MENAPASRFWEIDLMRAVAIIMMIIFHFLYDLEYFGDYDFKLGSLPWLFYARAGASVFIALVGISLTLNFSKAELEGISEKDTRLKQVKRGLMVFSWGLIITVITWYFLGEFVIVFGILHLIGLSIIIAIPFIKYRSLNLALGIIFIILGIILIYPNFEFSGLVWLGFRPMEYDYEDYFPLLPWFGVVLVGIVIGHALYPKYKRKFKLPDLSQNSVMKPLCFIGRYSLFIYLIHQPVLIAILYALGFANL